jgi:hypothetical protein
MVGRHRVEDLNVAVKNPLDGADAHHHLGAEASVRVGLELLASGEAAGENPRVEQAPPNGLSGESDLL